MVTDSNASDVLLFGGTPVNGGPQLNDTWTFAGGRWTELPGVGAPPPFRNASATDDPFLGGVFLVGSVAGGTTETWSYTSLGWREVRPQPVRPSAPPRGDARLRLFGNRRPLRRGGSRQRPPPVRLLDLGGRLHPPEPRRERPAAHRGGRRRGSGRRGRSAGHRDLPRPSTAPARPESGPSPGRFCGARRVVDDRIPGAGPLKPRRSPHGRSARSRAGAPRPRTTGRALAGARPPGATSFLEGPPPRRRRRRSPTQPHPFVPAPPSPGGADSHLPPGRPSRRLRARIRRGRLVRTKDRARAARRPRAGSGHRPPSETTVRLTNAAAMTAPTRRPSRNTGSARVSFGSYTAGGIPSRLGTTATRANRAAAPTLAEAAIENAGPRATVRGSAPVPTGSTALGDPPAAETTVSRPSSKTHDDDDNQAAVGTQEAKEIATKPSPTPPIESSNPSAPGPGVPANQKAPRRPRRTTAASPRAPGSNPAGSAIARGGQPRFPKSTPGRVDRG